MTSVTKETDERGVEISRRSLLDMALLIGGGLWGLGMVGPAAIYLWPARSAGPAESVLLVGTIDSIAPGEAKMTQSRGLPILVIRISEEKFKAFSAICTHLGCVVQWDPGRKVIACPCHAAEFSSDGQVVSGPPSSPLKEYQVMVIGEEIRVKVS